MNDLEIEYLSGQPTSKQDEISALLSNDMFLISQPIHSYMNREYTSNHIKMHTLASSVVSEYYEEDPFIFGTMAYELSDAWAKIVHYHNYTSVVVDTIYENSNDTELIATVYLSDDNNSQQLSIFHPISTIKYSIGELRFMAWPTLPIIDTDNPSEDFDGWTYPDGRYLSKTKYPDAYEYFGNEYGENNSQFRIPNLTQFLKAPDYDSDSNRLIVQQDIVSSLYEHYHIFSNVTFQENITFGLSAFTIPINESSGAVECNDNSDSLAHFICCSNNDAYISTIPIGVSADITLKNIIQSNIAKVGSNVETYPSYNDLPVLMYIGKPND